MTNVPFEEWARPKVGDLLGFAEGSDQRGSRIADLFALREADTSSRVTVWATDILSLMQSAFEEGWKQGASDLLDYQRGTGRYGPEEENPEDAEYDPGPEVDDQGGMSEYYPTAPEPWE